MLKPADPPAPTEPAGAEDEKPIGELVHQLIEDGKDYARAELGLAKAIASQKAGVLTLPAALLGGAFVLLVAGASALAVSLVLALADSVGPLGAGLIAFLLFAAIAGGLAWWAIRTAKRDL